MKEHTYTLHVRDL